MNTLTPAQRMLRKHRRTQKIPTVQGVIATRLGISIGDVVMTDLDLSDRVLELYRERFPMNEGNGSNRVRMIFRSAEEDAFIAFLCRLKKRIAPQPVLLYSVERNDCGSVSLDVGLVLDRARHLLTLNQDDAFAITPDSQNCIDLTFDTETVSEGSEPLFEITITGADWTQIAKNEQAGERADGK